MAKLIYLDNAATTQVYPEVLDAMLPYFTEYYGNPSAIYSFAGESKKAVDEARTNVAALINARTEDIYFTGGGSESDNWALKATAEAYESKGKHIITSRIEHHAILHTCAYLEQKGYEVTYLDVDEDGKISLEELEKAIRPDTILISIMSANNEIGTIQPIKEIGKIAHDHGVLFHTDAVQAFGHIPIDVEEMNIDMLSASASVLRISADNTSINRGKGDKEQANRILNTSFSMVCASALLLMGTGLLFAKPLLILFGASKNALTFARPYMMLYLLGTLPSMIATGMNPFINAQGYSTTGMFSVAIGAIANILLDPLFIFTFHLGVNGAAAATVLSQILSALFVFHFLRRKAEIKVRLLRKNELSSCIPLAKSIISLGTSGFIMQLTNSLVSICCNHVLSVTGGDVYVSVMTIVSSVRQMVETPIYAITEGSSPIISYNYGALRPMRVKKAGITMALMALVYTGLMWSVIILAPEYLISVFSSDTALSADAVPALKLYFAAFIFMDLQYIGQTVFKSLNKRKQAIFFSLLRKVFIVVPLTYLLPYTFHMGTDGVFLAEPVSNVIGGSLCFITMLFTVLPELNRMENQ